MAIYFVNRYIVSDSPNGVAIDNEAEKRELICIQIEGFEILVKIYWNTFANLMDEKEFLSLTESFEKGTNTLLNPILDAIDGRCFTKFGESSKGRKSLVVYADLKRDGRSLIIANPDEDKRFFSKEAKDNIAEIIQPKIIGNKPLLILRKPLSKA